MGIIIIRIILIAIIIGWITGVYVCWREAKKLKRSSKIAIFLGIFLPVLSILIYKYYKYRKGKIIILLLAPLYVFIYLSLFFLLFGPSGSDKGLTEFLHINKFLNQPINELVEPHKGPNTGKYSPVFTLEETQKAVDEYNRANPDNKISPEELENYLRNRNTRPSNSLSNKGLTHKLFSTDESKTIEELLTRVATEQSENLPFMQNEITQLTSVKASGKNLIFSHKLIDDFIITQSWVDEKVKENKIKGECNEPRWRNLLEKGATIILEYYNNNGDLGGSVVVNLSDCQKK